MPDVLLHISRNGTAVGTFTLEEAKELAEAGFLHPTDEAWSRGMTEWRPLDEFLGEVKDTSGDWRNKVIAGTTALSGVVGRKVGHFIAGVKSRAAQGQDAVTQAKTVALEQFLPQFQKRAAEYLRDKPAEFARAAVKNDAVTRKVFGALYDLLPRPLCRFVTEKDFVDFCMRHRQRILGGTNPAEPLANPTSPAPPPSAIDDASRT